MCFVSSQQIPVFVVTNINQLVLTVEMDSVIFEVGIEIWCLFRWTPGCEGCLYGLKLTTLIVQMIGIS